jgi:hypothetical protein
VSTIQVFTGFEWGTVHDVAAGNAGSKIFDGVTGVYGTNLDVVAGSGSALGSYVGQVATISNKNFFWDTNSLGTSKTDLVVSLRFRFTSFPTSDNDIHSIDVAATSDRAGFFYQVSTGKLVAWITTGTQVQTNAALVLNTWYTLQFKYSCSASINTLDWVLNGTTQTQATNNLGASTIARYALGNRGGSNGTIQFDDVVVSTTAGDHPLPLYNVRLVKADTGGTTAEIGTANSTARFTTNNTLDSTHNSANILAAVSEVPPTIGASASGVAQRAGGATDAVGIPMTSITLSGDTIAGCRILVCGWANSTGVNNIGVRAFNGSAETILVAGTVASGFTNSTTDPTWFAAMYAGVTDQTTLDALVVRLGYSTDIVPEPGAHAVYAEILTLPGSSSSVAVNGIPSSEQFGASSVTPGSTTLSPSGIASGEQFGSVTVTSVAVVSPSGIVSSEKFGSPTFSSVATVNAAGIPSGEQIGAASVTSVATVSPSGIKTGEQFGSATVASIVTVNGNGITSNETFGTPAITPGAVSATTSGITSGETFGSATVSAGPVTVTASGIVTAEKFGSPAVSTAVGVNPGGIQSGEAFGTSLVSPGVVIATPGSIGSSERFGATGISAGAVSVAPGGSGTSETFGNASVSGASAGIAANGIVSTEQFGSATVSSPTVTITASGIISKEQFGSATVTPGPVSLQMSGITTSERFGNASVVAVVDQVAHPGSIFSAEMFGNHHLVTGTARRAGVVVECNIDRLVIPCEIDRTRVEVVL